MVHPLPTSIGPLTNPSRFPAPIVSPWPPARRWCAGGVGSRSRERSSCQPQGRFWSSGTTTRTGTRSRSASRVARRQIRALAKASLWDIKLLAPILNGMGQIPIQRGKGDANALSTRSSGCEPELALAYSRKAPFRAARMLRARSGVGRLALDVPEANHWNEWHNRLRR